MQKPLRPKDGEEAIEMLKRGAPGVEMPTSKVMAFFRWMESKKLTMRLKCEANGAWTTLQLE